MEFIRFTWAHDKREHIINTAAIAYVGPAAKGDGATLHLMDGETILETVEPYDLVIYNLQARQMVPKPDHSKLGPPAVFG